MKKLLLLFTILFYYSGHSQNSYIVTSLEMLSPTPTPTNCTSQIIVVPPTGSPTTTTTTNFFTQPQTHEKDLNDQLKIIIALGYKIISTTTYSFGAYNNTFYIWTRYVLQN